MKRFHPSVQNGTIVMTEDERGYWISNRDLQKYKETLLAAFNDVVAEARGEQIHLSEYIHDMRELLK